MASLSIIWTSDIITFSTRVWDVFSVSKSFHSIAHSISPPYPWNKSYIGLETKLIDWFKNSFRPIISQTADEWKMVFFISSAIYMVGAIFYGIFASGERQAWAMESYASKKEKDVEQHAYTNPTAPTDHSWHFGIAFLTQSTLNVSYLYNKKTWLRLYNQYSLKRILSKGNFWPQRAIRGEVYFEIFSVLLWFIRIVNLLDITFSHLSQTCEIECLRKI